MKVMCEHCGSPNLDTDAVCYNCSKPPLDPKQAEPKPEAEPKPAKKATKK